MGCHIHVQTAILKMHLLVGSRDFTGDITVERIFPRSYGFENVTLISICICKFDFIHLLKSLSFINVREKSQTNYHVSPSPTVHCWLRREEYVMKSGVCWKPGMKSKQKRKTAASFWASLTEAAACRNITGGTESTCT
jgi:hypothetical protein